MIQRLQSLLGESMERMRSIRELPEFRENSLKLSLLMGNHLKLEKFI